MSGGKGGGQQTQSNEPWAPMQKSLLEAMNHQDTLFENGPGFYTNMNQQQRQGQDMALNFANGYGSLYNPYKDTLQGGIQNPTANQNPFGINNAVQQGLGGVGADPYGIRGALSQGLQGPSAGSNPFGINSAIQQGLQAPNVGNNPYLEQYAQAATRPLEQQLKFSTMPGIRSQGTAMQPGGGTRQGIAEGVATGLTNQAIGDTRANIFSNAYGQGLGAQANALGAANQAYGTDVARQQGAIGGANQAFGIGSNYQLGALGQANQSYGQGLDQQARMAALYPQLSQMGLIPSDIYSQVGGVNQADQNTQQTDIYRRLQFLQDGLTGLPSGTQSTLGGSGSTAMNALGGGVLGQGLGSMLLPGIGALSGGGVGALAGLLGGLFG